jgi:hypothetical protein
VRLVLVEPLRRHDQVEHVAVRGAVEIAAEVPPLALPLPAQIDGEAVARPAGAARRGAIEPGARRAARQQRACQPLGVVAQPAGQPLDRIARELGRVGHQRTAPATASSRAKASGSSHSHAGTWPRRRSFAQRAQRCGANGTVGDAAAARVSKIFPPEKTRTQRRPV